MAAYTPAQLSKPVAMATSTADLVKPSAGVTGIIRTMIVQAPTAQTVTLAIHTTTADSAPTRITDAYPITANVPWINNGWTVVENNTGASAWLMGKASATTVIFAAWGYNYS